jgi:hypothetical protein
LRQWINADAAWMEQLKTLTTISKKPVEDLVNLETRQICRDKIAYAIKAANGKFICAGTEEDKAIAANRDAASLWETFYVLSLPNNQVAIYSYKNKFLSAAMSGDGKVTSERANLGTWEVSTMIKLDNGLVAFKAIKDKYLSFDEKSQQIFARSNTIGKNEQFKLIGK